VHLFLCAVREVYCGGERAETHQWGTCLSCSLGVLCRCDCRVIPRSIHPSIHPSTTVITSFIIVVIIFFFS
jgi:hypothetical protein